MSTPVRFSSIYAIQLPADFPHNDRHQLYVDTQKAIKSGREPEPWIQGPSFPLFDQLYQEDAFHLCIVGSEDEFDPLIEEELDKRDLKKRFRIQAAFPGQYDNLFAAVAEFMDVFVSNALTHVGMVDNKLMLPTLHQVFKDYFFVDQHLPKEEEDPTFFIPDVKNPNKKPPDFKYPLPTLVATNIESPPRRYPARF